MNENIIRRLEGESRDDTLYRVGTLKKNKELDTTWYEIADLLNEEFGLDMDSSSWRQRYKRLAEATSNPVGMIYDQDLDEKMKDNIRQIEKQRIRLRAENARTRSALKQEATMDNFMEELASKIEKIEPLPTLINVSKRDDERAVYALLSDVHYGLKFSSFYGDYSPEIACARVMKYASEIIRLGELNKASTCYVSIMGDMISGMAHQTIRLENAETVVDQILHVSELTATFLSALASHFMVVYVNNVAGNHSRLDPSAENSLRAERLDNLIPWYAKARLANVGNIIFRANEKDTTLATFDILGKNYVAVHGDYDFDKQNMVRLQEALDMNIHYFLCGHMHVPEMRLENIGWIRNGAIVSGGDDYTTKKRLFGPAYQIAMICTPQGVEAIYPVAL